MAYNSMDDDEEARIAAMAGQYPAPLSAVAPRPVSSFAASLPLAYQPFADMLAANNAAMKKEVYDPQRERLEKYTKDLQARRAGPTAAERLYEAGAAFLKPTMTPGFAGTIANIAPVLAGQRKARREAEDAQSELALKYGLEIGNIGDKEAEGRISGQSALMKSIMEAQLKEKDATPPAVILIAKRLYPNDVRKQNAYILANSPAAVKGISATADDSTKQKMPWEL
jgi:hypothetical protein